ncbi:MAG: sulfatase [Fuerstiella sp.]
MRVPKSSVVLVLLSLIGTAAAADRPNLVFMIADDCTYLDMQVYGGQAKTPNLVKLASEGLQFTRCFQTAPMCSPTRHNIYTGIYPVKSGAWPNHTCVYPGTKSIAHYLQQAGYRVALSGKTHIAPRESFPFEYDSDFRTADPGAAAPYPAIDKLVAESTAAGTPFCLFACSNEPHTPWNKGNPEAYPPESLKLPPSWVDTSETRRQYSRYLAEITYFDAQCGALLQLLRRHNVADNTLVMVVSEQGSSFPFAKWTCFELGLASGMIVRWPGRVQPGTQTAALVEYCDVAPTFLEAAGLDCPETMEGRSFLPVLLGQKTEHKKYTFGIHTTRGIINGSDVFGIRSCGTKTHRYIRNLHPEVTFTNAVTRTDRSEEGIWGSWMAQAAEGDQHAVAMTRKYQHRPDEELYDVVNDPHCLQNLADDPKLAPVMAELSAELDAWMTSQGDHGRETEAIAHTRKAGYQKKQGKKKKKKDR